MKIKVNKPIEKLPLFVVVNSETMLWDGYEDEINTIILNGASTSELINVLGKTKAKSINYCYYLCIANCMAAIDELSELVCFMKQEGFDYYISPEQSEMYRQTIFNTFNEPTKDAV